VSDERRLTRQQFFRAAGAATLAFAVRPMGALAAMAPSTAPFLSRPDLAPPGVVVNTAGPTAPGSIFLAPFAISGTAGPHYGPMIVDNAGGLVWFKPVATKTAMGLRTQRYHGADVITWYEGDVLGGYGGDFVIADSSYRELKRVRAQHGMHGDLHEVLLTSHETALISIYQPATYDLTPVGGPVDGQLIEGVVQEIDLKSGRVVFEWRSGQHVSLDESYLAKVTPTNTCDYFHLNSIAVDSDGHLLVSARHTSAVYKVDRKSGAIKWRLGGKRSDYRFDPGASFSYQHDARRHADGTITIFDNAASAPPKPGAPVASSRAIRLYLDDKRMLAGLVTEYKPPQPRVAWAMGNAQQLPDGGMFVDWGTAGAFTEYGPHGDVRYDASFADGSVSYRAFRFPWSGAPAEPPAVAVTGSAGDRSLHVSWNGATHVHDWVARTVRGNKVVAHARRTGFETVLRVPEGHGAVFVNAVDASGAILAASKPVSL
jgi:hypothetical protein